MEFSFSQKPQIHFIPPSGWMNDPNGLVFFENEWHLFYQYLPPGGAPGKHWGHAVSPDLADWEHLPVALYPDSLGEIFSGSCVVDSQDTSGFFDGKPGLVAVFSHHLDSSKGAIQSQSLAYSADRGRTWTKYAANPVLPGDGPDFRDPKVFWHVPSSSWIMILAAGERAEIYRSPNLKTWTLASKFGQGITPLCWECPDLFPLLAEDGNQVWILSVSLLDRDNFRGMVAPCISKYFSGTFDGFTFTADEHGARSLTEGPDDYAAVTFSNTPDGSQILLGWLNHWGYASYTGQMTLPRQLQWKDRRLVQTLAPCFEKAKTWACARIEKPTDSPVQFSSSPWEIVMPETLISWKIEASKAGILIFTVQRDGLRGTYSLQRASGSYAQPLRDEKPYAEAFFTSLNEVLLSVRPSDATRIIVDRCSVEVFCDGGRGYFAAQIFPPDGEWQIVFALTDR